MKAISRIDRILQSLPGVAIAIGLCCGGIHAEAQTNAWISGVSGNWEDLSWSLGVRPGAGQSISITNGNWKAVQLTHTTAVNFPASLTVDAIQLDAPPETLNTLFLNNVGVSAPLTAGSITMTSNTVITMMSSALNSAGTLNMGGIFNHGFFSGVTVSNLYIGGNGVYNLTNGTLNVVDGLELLGVAGPESTFNQEGGFHYASLLSILTPGTYDLHGGQLGGNVQITGGTLNQTGGDLSPDSLNVEFGSLVQSGGTGSIGPTTVGRPPSNEGPPSSYTLSNGVPIFGSNVTITPYGIFDQEGGSNTIKGTLLVSSDNTYPGHTVLGTFLLNGGTLSAQDISVSGVYSQGGGTNQAAGDLTITGAQYSRCELAGGWLVTSNTTMLDGDGNFIQTGGRHQVSGTLHVTGGAEPAYELDGGEVIAPMIEITYGTFSHRGGTVTNRALLRLNGWWDEFAGNQQFGQLQIDATDASSLWFGTNSAILRFADSSGQAWGSGILHVRNWSGSLGGGGGNQLIFGNSSAALTTAQVAQIRFDYYPSREYTAKILPTGEVVPNPSGAPYAPDGLGAQGISAHQINLTWTDNSIDETGFAVERSPDGTNFVQITTIAANTTSYSDTGLTPMTAYFYRVRAYNGSGDSSYTSVAEASTKASGQPPLAGMIAWWPAENSADDVIGGHNGTTPYGIAYTAGESGQAFDFDASNRRVFVPDSPDFVPTNGFTFEGWFYARQTLDAYIGMRGDDRGGLDCWAVHRLSDGQLSFRIDDMLNNFVVIETPVQNNQWYHFAATFDSATGGMKLYINGALAVQTNTTIQVIGAYEPGWNPGIGIGNESGTITQTSFDGLIDDVALYSRALSPAEIQSIYNAGTAGKAGLGQTPTNAWISGVSGNWENSHWSLGALPGTNQAILLTNAGWKALAIGPNTAQNFPQTLTVGSLTVSSPGTDTVNTLLLNYAGLQTPLLIGNAGNGSLSIGSNCAVAMFSSALKFLDGSVSGTFIESEGSQVTAQTLHLGIDGPAVFNFTNSTLSGFEYIGGFPATFYQQGGTNLGALILEASGEYNLFDGSFANYVRFQGGNFNQFGGNVSATVQFVNGDSEYHLAGGTLLCGDLVMPGIPPPGLFDSGVFLQTGGTNACGAIKLGGSDAGSGSYNLSGGVLIASSLSIAPYEDDAFNVFGNSFSQSGGIHTNGELSIMGGYNMEFEIMPSTYHLSGGILSTPSIGLNMGAFAQSGGTNEVGSISLSQESTYSLSGGWLIASNIQQNGGQLFTQTGSFDQSGGTNEVGGNLLLEASYTFSGGQLTAHNIQVNGGSSFHHIGGALSLPGVLTLANGTWDEQTSGEHLGQLQLSGDTNSFLNLPSDSCVLNFADSSGLTWSNTVALDIENWSGSVYGGGKQQIIFGNNSSALTAQQLSRIQFQNPGGLTSGTYPARILATGEIVPVCGAPLPLMLHLLSNQSNNAMQLSIEGGIGQTYRIEISTDLVSWIGWTNQSNANGTISIFDGGATNYPQRFYRARLIQ